ncbi:MAG: sigma 54-interacting transcriptional regulator [Deltaproteobacteria bacterium]|nr:sigma 54-interacting transcriptional regulator [Deltaproteobacteria bacterium]
MAHVVVVTGSPPDPGFLHWLEDAGVRAEPHDGPAVICRLVLGDQKRVPRSVDDRPWLWLPRTDPGQQRCHAAVVAGAVDVVPRDLPMPVLLARVVTRLDELSFAQLPLPAHDQVIANSAAGQRLLQQLFRAAQSSQPVLLTGETGTGKDVGAHLIHDWSARRAQPFVPVNCAAIPNELMEAELFGYAKGAFSGAIKGFDGQLGAATGGSVFLDEIDDTPLPLQMKLLRVLEDHVVVRLGESEPRHVDFRIIAATNRDLPALVAGGDFGADLFERLAIVRVEMPPLRERVDDIPALVALLLKRFRHEEQHAHGRAVVDDVTPAALAALQAHPWPGNIRELRNVVFEALVYKRAGRELLLSDLPRRVLLKSDADVVVDVSLDERVARGGFDLKGALDDLELRALKAALRHGKTAAGAARLLGRVGRGTARDPAGTVRAMMTRWNLR